MPFAALALLPALAICCAPSSGSASGGDAAGSPSDSVVEVELIDSLVYPATPYDESHETVDLGLPSGTLWAAHNIGVVPNDTAYYPDQGYLFAWGETQPKESYSWENYTFASDDGVTKYTTASGLTRLEPSDDPATVIWGDMWCTPTSEQWEELFNSCDASFTMEGMIIGCHLTSKANGKMLYLPAVAAYDGVEPLSGEVVGGYYWASQLNESDDKCAQFLFFYANGSGVDVSNSGNYSRHYGMPIRPVMKP